MDQPNGVKDKFLSLRYFLLKDGSQIRFWEDICLRDQTLKSQFTYLFSMVHWRHATVAKVFSTTPLNISSRRALVGNKLHDWLYIVDKLLNVNLQEGRYTFSCSLQANGFFIVHSIYIYLVNSKGYTRDLVWKIHLKSKLFMWYSKSDVLLAKDNSARHN